MSAFNDCEPGSPRTHESTSSRIENDHRKRAYTLLVRSYNEVRRVISFLRWHDGDAEDIAPSLHTAGRAARRSDEEAAEEPEPAAAPTGSPVAVQGANPAVA